MSSIHISELPSSDYSHKAPTAPTTASNNDDSVYEAIFGPKPPSVTFGPEPRDAKYWCLPHKEYAKIFAANPNSKDFIDDTSGPGKKKITKKEFLELIAADCERQEQEAMRKQFEGFQQQPPPWGDDKDLQRWLVEHGVVVHE